MGLLYLIVLLLSLISSGASSLTWNVDVKTNPGCTYQCDDQFPNLVHVAARNSRYSVHFFTAASKILGPPSIFIVKSPKPDANVHVNWSRLFDNHMYGGIKVEQSDEIYGLTYLSIVVFSDPDGHADLWTASKSNKTYQEYYLSQLEYSLIRADPVPDPSTGLVHLVYRSDSRRRHKLLSDGGFITIKVTISCKDTLQDLKAGLAFKSEISFHNLTIPHPTSKLGVGVVLFSNLSLSLGGDFRESKSILSLPGKPNLPYQISSTHLESEEESVALHSMIQGGSIQSPFDRRKALTPVLFRPSPVGNLGADGKVVPVTVLAGPRNSLRGGNQRRRLTRSIGKALYGKEFEQNFQKTKLGPLKQYPVGMRLQHFAFSARGQQAAEHISWPVTLTMEAVPEPTVSRSVMDNPKQALYSWGLFVLNWISSIYEK